MFLHTPHHIIGIACGNRARHLADGEDLLETRPLSRANWALQLVHGVAPVTPRQLAWFRIIFGVYLAIQFAHLVPWGAELFSREGVIPRASLNPTQGILPNVLAWWDSPAFVTAFLLAMVALSVSLRGRRSPSGSGAAAVVRLGVPLQSQRPD